VEREDLRRIYELEQDVEIFLLGDDPWQPMPFAQYEKEFEKRLDADEWARFAIEADGRVIGVIGLHGQNRREGTTEFGIYIGDRAYLGKGYGRDAVNVLLGWAFRVQNWRRVWLEVLATNERAIRAYRACGFVEEGRLRKQAFFNGQYVDMVLMGLLREEWRGDVVTR
jgi:RimJ/RimL family protein N-acetyltransferase